MFAPTYVVQSFFQQGRRLVADQARKMSSEKAAIESAKRLAERKIGVIAYSVVYDPEADVTSELQVLFRAGTLPAELAEA